MMKSSNLKLKTKSTPIVRAFETWKTAAPWSRVAAQLIDQTVVAFAAVSAMALWFPHKTWTPRWWGTLSLLWILLSWMTQSLFLWFYKNTLGKHALGLKIESTEVHPNGDKELRFSQTLIRSFTWWLGALTLGAGWCTILSRNDRRAWHDLASQTVVTAPQGEAARLTILEQKVGNGWLAFLSVVFNVVIASALLLELGKLSDFTAMLWTSPEVKQEQAAWTVLATNGGDEPAAMELAQARQPASKEVEPYTILSTLEKINQADKEVEFLKSELAQAQPATTPYYALLTAMAHIYIKTGDFNAATHVLQNEVTELKKTDLRGAQKIFGDHMTEAYYQAQALAGGHVTLGEENNTEFWKNWNEGVESKDTQFRSSGATLGYWWNKLNATGFDAEASVEDWNKAREKYNFNDESAFEKSVAAAIDFTITLKQTSPEGLLEKSKNLGSHNMVWGWAQGQALKRYGTQWAALIRPSDQRLLNRYQTAAVKDSSRDVASLRKKSLTGKPRRPLELLKAPSEQE